MSEQYQVLARKYRPESFADLIGQDAMVRTLRNAFAADRIHHAFIMTGIRGTGKTTTARIIAKGLNCIGLDGQGGPTTEPCGQCEHCRAIIEGRHVDEIKRWNPPRARGRGDQFREDYRFCRLSRGGRPLQELSISRRSSTMLSKARVQTPC